MTLKRYVKKSLSILVIGVTIYFFSRTLVDNWENVRELSLTFSTHSIFAVLFLVLSVVSSGVLWGHILNTLSPMNPITTHEAVRIHSASWLLKYIPGQAGSYLNKIAWGAKHGFSKKIITNSFIYENVFLLIASIIPTIPIVLVAFSENVIGNYDVFLPLLVALPFLLVLNKNVFYWISNTLFKKIRKQEISKDLFLSTRQIAVLQLQFIVPRILNGSGFVFLAQSIFNVEPSMYIPLGAIYVLAGIVGLLAIFVPSGLGVREAVIVALATVYFTPAEAIVLSIAARFYATIADLGVFGVYLLLNKGKIKQA